jgi:hypothetical protein
MATKKTTDVVAIPSIESVKPIILRDEKTGDCFVLEFNRTSIKFAESRGFNISDIEKSGVNMTLIEELFFYAFRMHHPEKTKADTDKIMYEKLCGLPEKMLERLIELYAIPLNTLVQTEESAKNATMTVEL